MSRRYQLCAALLILSTLTAHAGLLAADDADAPVYSNSDQFYTGQNGGYGFDAWSGGVDANMECINNTELTLNHYWKISGAQTLQRNFANSVTLSHGTLSLAAQHQTGGAIQLTSSEGLPLLKIETGTYFDDDAWANVSGFIITSGLSTTTLQASTEGNRIDYEIEWDTAQQTYQFSAIIDQGEYGSPTTNTLLGTLASEIAVGGIAFKTDNAELHFDDLRVEVIPEPAAISLVLLCSGGMLYVKRLFYV